MMTSTQQNTVAIWETHLTMRLLLLTKLLFVMTFLLLLLPLFAQGGQQVGARPLTNDWNRVQALPLQSRIRVVSDQNKATCFVDAVTADHLTCSRSRGHQDTQMGYSREQVKQIKLTHRARSSAAGAAIGVAVGAGVGAAVFLGLNENIHTASTRAAGAGAAVGSVALGLVGGALGYGLDIFAGPVIYQRPRS